MSESEHNANRISLETGLMNRRSITLATVLATALSITSVFFFDRPIAQLMQQLGGEHSKFLAVGTIVLEIASGMTLSKFALGFALMIAGAALLAWKSRRDIAWILLFVGCTHFTARLIAGVLKEVFHRLRPVEVLASGAWDSQFFTAHGGAFPSGHTAQFWALFFPLAFLFPRLCIPLLILPIFIAVARVGVNDHWLSDVLASIAICSAMTLFFIWIFRWQKDLPTQQRSATG
jgi:membrane-associated phospholipid phosphatase